MLMAGLVIGLKARKRDSKQKKIVVKADMKEVEWKQAGVEVLEEEYSDFI